jgi:hypothetical protein
VTGQPDARKKHTLKEHLDSVQTWDTIGGALLGRNDSGRQTLFFVAYERWLNDRPLLRDEDRT